MVISSQDDTNLETKPSTPQYPDWTVERKQFFEDLASKKIHRNFRGRLDDNINLREIAAHSSVGDVIEWQGENWILTPDKAWVQDKPEDVNTDDLVLTEEHPPHELVPSITFKGSWPHDDELPNPETAETWDAWMYKGRMWVKRPEGHWDKLPEFATHPLTTFASTDPYHELLMSLASAFGEEGLFNIVGRVEILPQPALYREGQAFIVHDDIWIRVFNKQPVWQQIHSPELVKEQIRLYDERQKKLTEEPEEVRREDKGALARELMEQKAEVKRLHRARIKYLCFLWLIILLIVAGFGTAAYAYVKQDLVVGRYSDSRDCSIKVGNLTITGKRTYSYPAYSLWGQRWVQESNVQEVTTINLPGSKLDILMDAEPKWIGYRFSDGERGTQILKPALKYAFVMDKGMAMATYGGFCQPLDKQAVPDDPKNQERTIIN